MKQMDEGGGSLDQTLAVTGEELSRILVLRETPGMLESSTVSLLGFWLRSSGKQHCEWTKADAQTSLASHPA